MYELIQEPDGDISEAQVNITEDNKDLNVNPKSKSALREFRPTLRKELKFRTPIRMS